MILAKTNFGQSNSGHSIFGPIHFRIWCLWPQRRGGGRIAQPRKGWGPERCGIGEERGAKFCVFFSPLPLPVSLFLSLFVCFLVEFWWCLKRRGPQTCTFGVLGLSCETSTQPRTPATGQRLFASAPRLSSFDVDADLSAVSARNEPSCGSSCHLCLLRPRTPQQHGKGAFIYADSATRVGGGWLEVHRISTASTPSTHFPLMLQ